MSLVEVFANTLSADQGVRQVAEQQLAEAGKDPGLVFALLDVIGSTGDLSVCMSASLYLKNYIFECWNRRSNNIEAGTGGSGSRNSQDSSFSDHANAGGTSIEKHGGVASGPVVLSVDQRNLFREKLLNTLVVVPHHAALTPLVAALQFIITSEPFPQAWPGLLPFVSQLLDSSSPKEVYIAVLCLVEVLRSYRWHDKASENRDQIIEAFLPKLVELGMSLIQGIPENQANLETTGEIIWRILKVYKQATASNLSPLLQNRNQLERWLNLFISVITVVGDEDTSGSGESAAGASSVSSSGSPTVGGGSGPNSASHSRSSSSVSIGQGLLELAAWRKCYKWSFTLVNLLFVRYSVIPELTKRSPNQDLVQEHAIYHEFSQLFITSFAPEVCKMYIDRVRGLPRTVSLKQTASPEVALARSRAQRLIILFFVNCLQIESLWTIVLSELDMILNKIIFSNLRMKERDLYSYQYEPDQFFYEQEDQQEFLFSTKVTAGTFVQALVARRASVALPGVLMTVNNILEIQLNNLTDLECCLDVDAALQIMISIAEAPPTARSPIILNQMGKFINNYILPIFHKSNQLFLYSRSFQLIVTYASIIGFGEDVLKPICENILKCLDSTDDVLTKINAAIALEALLKYDFVVQTQSPTIQHTMEKILELYDTDVVSEKLANVMEVLVSTFSRELIPFAVKLCRHLSSQLLRILDELRENQEETQARGGQIDYEFLDEKADNAQHILGTLSTLLNSFQDYGQEVSGLEETIANMVKPVLDSGEVDLYPEMAELVDIIILTNRSVSEGLWNSVFNSFYEAFQTQPEASIEAIILSTTNFVAYGGAGITKERLEKIFQMIHYAVNEPQVELHVKKNASQLIEFILIAIPDSAAYSITDLIPFVIQMPGRSLNMIVACLYRDALRSLTANNNSLVNMFDELLSEWTRATIYGRELKVNIGAALQVVSLRDDNLVSLEQRIALFQFIINKVELVRPPLTTSTNSAEQPTQNTFEFVTEPYSFARVEDESSQIEEELPPSLDAAIDSIDIRTMYTKIVNELATSGPEYTQTLVQSLSPHQREIHTSLLQNPH
ncbi:Nmd5p [Sugiyamaella lignohabitans]|uniref:Nmd5p n=1 Tax=Sugiyamaella lignohabitans TaxID=796027 RepID=A0A161HJC5_9ASCO|nr:Nmd5p [Sugiyamaella lignohabitans]ANB11488.1 Nmd5p [Sugiyamaella lignohabitans]